MSEEEKSESNFLFKSQHLLILAAGCFIISIGILASSIYFFSNPNIVSGVVFGLAIVVLGIVPLILMIIFYFKKIRPMKEDEIQQIIEITKMDHKSRIDNLD